jgi:hypothetical protein
MGKLNSFFVKPDAPVVVNLQTSRFGSGDYFGKVSRYTVDTDNIIAYVAEKNPGVDMYAVRHSAELLKREMLSLIGSGYAISMLDLGTLFPSVNGPVSGSNPTAADIPGIIMKFTPSHEAQEAVSRIVVDTVTFTDGSPVVSEVTDLKTKKTDGTLSAGYSVRINGRCLKLGGSEYGIWFVPQKDDGTAEADETKWIAVDASLISRNDPSTLEFPLYAPIVSGTKYLLAVRTSISRSGTERKSPVTGFSAVSVMLA